MRRPLAHLEAWGELEEAFGPDASVAMLVDGISEVRSEANRFKPAALITNGGETAEEFGKIVGMPSPSKMSVLAGGNACSCIERRTLVPCPPLTPARRSSCWPRTVC